MRGMLIAMIAGLCMGGICSAAGFDPLEGPKPIAAYCFWYAGGDGSENGPRVVIYENGEVIFYARHGDDGGDYYSFMLDRNGLKKVRAKLKAVMKLKGLRSRYDIYHHLTINILFPPTALFYFRDGGREVTTKVYGLGLLPTDSNLSGYIDNPRELSRIQDMLTHDQQFPPEEILDFHRLLLELRSPDIKEWKPKYIKVVFHEPTDAPEDWIKWPEDWPSLDSERAFRKGTGDYTIFLDGSLYQKLRDFLARRKPGSAVEISGRKLDFSYYRPVLPGEILWQRVFKGAGYRYDFY